MEIKNCFSPKYSFNYRSQNVGFFYVSWKDENCKSFHAKDELENYKKQIQTLLNNDGKGKIGKTLYVGKGSNAPRHKIKSLIEENKIKKTSIIENSDTVILDKKVINDIFKWLNRCKEVKIAVTPYTKNLLNIIEQENKKNAQDHHLKRFKEYFGRKAQLVLYDNEYTSFPNDFKNELGNLDWEVYYEIDTYRTKNIQDVFDTLQYYFKNPHGNIIWDDEILETLNSDGIDLDNDYIDTLNSMFASNESDNIKLAFEMLANVNLEKHGLSIALLLNKHQGVMSWGNGNTNSQAYKTLDRYFGNKGINWKMDFRTFTTGLFNNYSDEKSREIISNFLLSNINTFLSRNGFRLDGEFLQIDSFKISKHKK